MYVSHLIILYFLPDLKQTSECHIEISQFLDCSLILVDIFLFANSFCDMFQLLIINLEMYG